MLISYPILEAPCQEDLSSGSYLSNNLGRWHGGIHIKVPTQGESSLIRAIADGEVVAYRLPKKRPESLEAQKQDPLYYHLGWTSDGFVLLKHKKECGQGKEFEFYSLYMHLSEIVHPDLKTSGGVIVNPMKPGKKITDKPEPIGILRKHPLGKAGCIDGQSNLFHFEIFLAKESLDKIWPNLWSRKGQQNLSFSADNGSPDPWGELIFVLPKGKSLYHLDDEKGQPGLSKESKPDTYILGLTYHEGDAKLRLLDNQGQCVTEWTSKEVEYNLYKKACRFEEVSRAYELMRFGRCMPWEGLEQDPVPKGLHRWQWLWCFDRWVDLASPDVQRASDADFPGWYWQRLELGTVLAAETMDVKPDKVFSSLFPSGDLIGATPWASWLTQPAAQGALRGLIVRQKSEWDKRNFDNRWASVLDQWTGSQEKEKMRITQKEIAFIDAQLTAFPATLASHQKRLDILQQARSKLTQYPDKQLCCDQAMAKHKSNLEKLNVCSSSLTAKKAALTGIKNHDSPMDPSPKAREDYKKHLNALQWYDQVSGLPEAPYFFHPLAFIDHFKKCAWLISSEIKHVYPTTDLEIIENYRLAINHVVIKYGIGCSLERMVHFLGQGGHESNCLRSMIEQSNNEASWAAEKIDSFYKDIDLWGNFFNYENPKQQLGNVEISELKNKKGEVIKVELKMGKKYLEVIKPKNIDEVDEQNSHIGDGQKFRGRGMKQLTGRANYSDYWVYRGWLNKKSFKAYWWSNKNINPAKIDNPQRISAIPFNCIDTGGWFWLTKKINNLITECINKNENKENRILYITKKINGGVNGLDSREFYTYNCITLCCDGCNYTPEIDFQKYKKRREAERASKKKKNNTKNGSKK